MSELTAFQKLASLENCNLSFEVINESTRLQHGERVEKAEDNFFRFKVRGTCETFRPNEYVEAKSGDLVEKKGTMLKRITVDDDGSTIEEARNKAANSLVSLLGL